MSTDAIEIMGTLRADGTLVLDQNPGLPPGRVKVLVEQTHKRQTFGDLRGFLDRVRQEQRETGHTPRTREEIDRELAESRWENQREKSFEASVDQSFPKDFRPGAA